jgi:pullulanase
MEVSKKILKHLAVVLIFTIFMSFATVLPNTQAKAATNVMQLGAIYTSTQTTFRIWSPDSSNVKVVVNGTTYTCSKIADFNNYTNIYQTIVSGDLKLKEYQFQINSVGVRDPYGVMVKPGTNTNIVMDVGNIQPTGGWAATPTLSKREDAVIYEANIRDFTIDSTSGVDSAKNGKYLGMVQTGTTYNGYKTGIDHLKELGVNVVQIMPFEDFGNTLPNWGYDPVNYNVPEEQYSATPTDYENRIREVQTMVNEFHKNGIRVVMDVVYNHTNSTDMFSNISSKYYTGNNDSGCGNAIDTSNAMVSRMIQDSLQYWVNEFNIDGFRFDLMGVFQYSAANQWGNFLNTTYSSRNLLLYGEPWNGGYTDPNESTKVRYGAMPALANSHIGAFNGAYRDAIKGDLDGTVQGYMFNYGDYSSSIQLGTRGSMLATKSTSVLSNIWNPAFAYDPEQTINYVSVHDNLNLWDKIKKCGQDSDYGKRIDRFATGMALSSQGIPLICSGDEFLRTKVYNGDWTYAANSYNAPDNYNAIKWNLKADNYSVFTYYKDLIQLRKNHPGFRLNTWDEINNLMTATVSNKVVTSIINTTGKGDTWSQIAIVYNPNGAIQASLPGTGWGKAFDINGANPTDQTITCEGTAVTIFYKTSTITNSGFESGSTSGWITSLGTNCGVDTSDIHSGSYKAYFYGTNFQQKIDQTIPVTNGTHTIKAWVKQNSGTPELCRMELSGYGSSTVYTNVSPGSSYVQISGTVNVTNGTINIAFYESATGTANLQIDDVTID